MDKVKQELIKNFDDKLNSTLTELLSKFYDQELQLQVKTKEEEKLDEITIIYLIRNQSHCAMN